MRSIYKNLILINSKQTNKINTNFNYLNFSIYLSRDDREFDINNYLLLKKLNMSPKTNHKFIKKQKGKVGYYKYLESFKEYKYLPSIRLIFIFIIDFLKYIKQIIDIAGLIIIVFISSLFNLKNLHNKKNFQFKDQKIFSIYYWINKKSKSASYYYPNVNYLTDDQY